ncbi:MAG: class I SAM-dependent methyltransferase [Pseudomonadota bacterium]|nr:class I SAM-dependent methyltransferase [Pseudomonadota bacterium]
MLGASAQRISEDRRVLEREILPSFARRSDTHRVLFVGCAAYTQRYGELFVDREYWTIDSVPRRRLYGSERHIVDRLENLANHVEPEYFDVIICNGVLGWGLNSPDDAEAAFAACRQHLRAGGELVVGWNDVAPRNRVKPEDISALRRFEPSGSEHGQQSRIRIDAPHRHVFDFYRKP